jgi:hypothetical protein
MFTTEQYRAKAIEYRNLLKMANDPNAVREFRRLERTGCGQCKDASIAHAPLSYLAQPAGAGSHLVGPA